MFDQEDYYSDEDENVINSHKAMASSKVLVPSSGSDFNHLTGEGESLLKIMRDRGCNRCRKAVDITDNEVKKIRVVNASKEKDTGKAKPKTGFFDGGASANLEQLMKALNKSFSKADPQQASCILSYILQKKNLSAEDRSKFGIMKCKLLFGLGAYQDCCSKAEELIEKPLNKLSAAILSNYIAKSKAELNQVLSGYLDFLRAKSMINEYKSITDKNEWLRQNQKRQKPDKQVQKQQRPSEVVSENFADSQVDTIMREIDHTELQYNIKMTKYKNSSNLVHPFFSEFRHRKIKQVVCGDFHALFLVTGSIGQKEQMVSKNRWSSQVFGIGENTVGQITGISGSVIYKEPVLISELSGKNICGIWANKESSLAYDENGNIYEWGIKETRNDKIQITFTVGQEIAHFQKGYQHYALLTVSNKCKKINNSVYTWGSIQSKGGNIYKQAKPATQAQNIQSFSCGNSSIIAVDANGQVFCLGSNEYGQLGLIGQFHAKSFKKLNDPSLGRIRQVFCINDATFFVNSDEQMYFCGRISYSRQPLERPRQGEFGGDINFIISVSGTVGNYYVTNEVGELYRWDVDSSVKFKVQRENQKIPQRYVNTMRGSIFKVRSLPIPQLSKVKRITEQPKSYQDINFQLELRDQLGPFGNSNFVMPPKCQIFLSTYQIKKEDLLKENKLFLESYQFSTQQENKILINQIVEMRINNFKMVRNEERPWIFDLSISSEESGKFFFYVLMENCLVFSEQLNIQVSQKEREYSEKNKMEKLMKQQERRKRAQMEKQRLLEQKLRKETEEQERRRQTQKRAEEALKKHMKEQQEMRIKAEQQKKARKDLQTGGGFDLSKLKPKAQTKFEIMERSSELSKTNQSFLPDINMRPSSKRKLNLPSKGTLNNFDSFKEQKPASNKFMQEVASSSLTSGLFKTQSQKQSKEPLRSSKGADSLSKTGNPLNQTKTTVLKRGLSKGKKLP